MKLTEINNTLYLETKAHKLNFSFFVGSYMSYAAIGNFVFQYKNSIGEFWAFIGSLLFIYSFITLWSWFEWIKRN